MLTIGTPDFLSLALRVVSFVLALNAAGLPIFIVVFGYLVPDSLTATARLGWKMAIGAVVFVVAHHLLEAARMAGDMAGVADPSLQVMALRSPEGGAFALRAVGLLLIAAGLRSRARSRLISADASPAALVRVEPAVPAGVGPAVSAGAEPAVPAGVGPAASAGVGPAVSAGVGPAVSAGVGPAVSAGAEPAVPAGVGPAASAGAEPAMPAGVGPAVSAGAGAAAPAGVGAAAPAGVGLAVRIALLGTALAIASFALTGHTSSTPHRPAAAASLVLHLLVVSFWIGALLPLHNIARSEPHPVAGRLINTFSRVAAWLVPIILLAGVTLAAFLVPDLSTFKRPYGQLLLAKAVVFAVLMALAALNKWRHGPACEGGETRAFRQTVIAEYVLICLVLALTATMTTFYSPEES